MHDMRLTTISQPSSEPWTVLGREMIGPTPLAFTIHQIKKVMPATGATTDFRVKRCRLCTQKGVSTKTLSFGGMELTFCGSGTRWQEVKLTRKERNTWNPVSSFQTTLEGYWLLLFGYLSKSFGTDHARISFTLGQIARSMTFMQSPPILACTPYQMLRYGVRDKVNIIEIITHHAIAPRLNVHHRLP